MWVLKPFNIYIKSLLSVNTDLCFEINLMKG